MSDSLPPLGEPLFDLTPEFDVGDLYSAGWGLLGSKYGLLLGAVLIFALINVAAGVGIAIIEQVSLGLGTLLNLVFSLLVSPPLVAGLFYLGVRVSREEACGVEAMFAGFSRYWVVVGINILLALVVIACLIPGGVMLVVGAVAAAGSPSAGLALMILGGVISIALTIFVTLRLGLASLACLDPENGYPGVFDSLTLTWRATARVTGRMLLLYLLVTLTMLATILLLCIGLFVVGYPFAVAVCGAAYCAIFSPLHAALEAQQVPFESADFRS